MNQERIIKLIQMELTTEHLSLEGELERVINSNVEIDKKLAKVKKILAKLVASEASLVKFISLTSNADNNEK